jgi:hydrogenase/urease accessory protein HupE
MMIRDLQKWISCSLGLFMVLLTASPMALRADEFRPALLELTELESGWVEVIWKVPSKDDKALGIVPVFPDFMEPIGSGSGRKVPGAWLETTTFRTGGQSLSGATLRVEGLDKVPTDVMLRVKLKDGGEHAAILRSGKESFTVPLEATKWVVAKSYTRIGFSHILEGYDHLLFLVALLLIVSNFRKLLWTITAFTLAHSITLALSTLGVVNFPSAPTEAVISLSILFLAVEVLRLRAGEVPLTAKAPWLVAFSFGLFHGLGFAGALSEVGIPQNEVPLALLMFNVGVELGQVAFVSVVASLFALLARWQLPEWKFRDKILPYAIGSIAAFWTIERTLSFLVR